MKILKKIRWYHIGSIIGIVLLVSVFVDLGLQDYNAHIVYDAGFIPNEWNPLFIFIGFIFILISFGGYFEAGLERYKINKPNVR